MHTAAFGVFGIIRYKFNLNAIVMRMSGPFNRLWTYFFGSAIIQSVELNIETVNAEAENVMQLMMYKSEVVEGICETFGDDTYENRP